MSKNDVASLKGFGTILRETFALNLAKGSKLKAFNIRENNSKSFGPGNILDNDRYSHWATDDSVVTPELILDLGKPKRFNVISIRENIRLGQRAGSFAIDAWEDGRWQQVAGATSIGNLRLIRLHEYITTEKVKLRITGSPVCTAISDFGLYAEPAHSSTHPFVRRN